MRRSASEVLRELEMRVARIERQSTSNVEIDGIDLGFKTVRPKLEKMIGMLMSKLKRTYPTGHQGHNKKISERQWDAFEKEMTRILKIRSTKSRKQDVIRGLMDKIPLASWNLDSSVELLLNKTIHASMST